MSSTIASAIDDSTSVNPSTSSLNDGVVAAPTAIKLSSGGLGGVEGFEGKFSFLEESVFGSSSSASSAESSFAGSPSHSGIFPDPLIASSNDNASNEFTFPPAFTNENTIDLEKQQQHHLQQFLFYQNLAIQRQEAVAKQLAQQQEIDNLLLGASSTSGASVPSLSPSPSTPPAASSPDVASLSSAIDSMQGYQYNLGGNVSNPNTKMDAFVGGQTAAGQQAISTNGYSQRAPQTYHQLLANGSSRHSVSGYPSAPAAMDCNVMYNGYASTMGGRNSFDGVPINHGQSMQRTNTVGHLGQNGFGGVGTQMSLSDSSAPDGGLVKGPYMVSNGGNTFYAATPAGSEATYQAQQAQLHQAVTNAAFDMAAMYQPMQQQYQSSYPHQQTPNSSTAVPYAAHNLSVPSYYRVHSADPVVAQATATGAVKMESVSPRASISAPTIRSVDVDELEASAAASLKQRDSNASSRASKVSAFPSSGSSGPDSAAQSVNGEVDISKVILNPLGGGRGYVPGETPDDPKKRHKCNVCGRGFARLFNLKSHQQTHDPLRLKPHVCPHETCARSFSRLHDLERHRQGVHFDGPLMVAKRQGISPSIARAQYRLAKRAERGALV